MDLDAAIVRPAVERALGLPLGRLIEWAATPILARCSMRSADGVVVEPHGGCSGARAGTSAEPGTCTTKRHVAGS